MAQLSPPQAPPVALSDGDGLRRMHARLWMLLMTTVTLLITIWICTFGIIPAVLAIMVAKHVLVAILVLGLGVDERQHVGS